MADTYLQVAKGLLILRATLARLNVFDENLGPEWLNEVTSRKIVAIVNLLAPLDRIT